MPLEIEEHSHAGMANRYVAGASGLPFAVLRGYNGTGLETLNGGRAPTPSIKPITCPFTGETLTAVSAIRPDVAVIHAQRADRSGNVQLWGITGVQKEAVLASARSVVTVEEIVDELDPRPGAMVLPAWTVSFVARVPGGAHPPTRSATRPATTTTTWPGTPSPGIARRSPGGWMSRSTRCPRGSHDLRARAIRRTR